MPISRNFHRFATALSGLTVRAGLRQNPLVDRLARAAKRRWFAELIAEDSPTLWVKARGVHLHIPRRFIPHYFKSQYEPLTVGWITSYLRRGMIVADVGAHIGFITIVMAKLVGPTGRVYAVEPAIENLQFLRSNLAANRIINVDTVAAAAGRDTSMRAFNITGSSDSHSFYSHPLTATVDTVVVPQLPLDAIVGGRLDLAKIDVEGAEIEVLQGMESLIRGNRELRLAIEWNPACLASAGHNPQDLPAYLVSRGFDLRVADESSRCFRTVSDVLASLTTNRLPPHWYANLLATPPESAI